MWNHTLSVEVVPVLFSQNKWKNLCFCESMQQIHGITMAARLKILGLALSYWAWLSATHCWAPAGGLSRSSRHLCLPPHQTQAATPTGSSQISNAAHLVAFFTPSFKINYSYLIGLGLRVSQITADNWLEMINHSDWYIMGSLSSTSGKT